MSDFENNNPLEQQNNPPASQPAEGQPGETQPVQESVQPSAPQQEPAYTEKPVPHLTLEPDLPPDPPAPDHTGPHRPGRQSLPLPIPAIRPSLPMARPSIPSRSSRLPRNTSLPNTARRPSSPIILTRPSSTIPRRQAMPKRAAWQRACWPLCWACSACIISTWALTPGAPSSLSSPWQGAC